MRTLPHHNKHTHTVCTALWGGSWTHFHSQSPPQLEAGTLDKVLLGNDRIIPLPGHGYGECRQDGILDEATCQLKPRGQLILGGKGREEEEESKMTKRERGRDT